MSKSYNCEELTEFPYFAKHTLSLCTMKKILLTTLAAFTALALSAQQDVYLRIMHQWDGQPFGLNQTATSDLGEDLTLSRLEYYISGIELTHDGGQTLSLDSVYVLANGANLMEEVNLGNLNITTLESVSFAIGVDQATNHLDPAQYSFNHPLAPKSPSMHWGWVGGYRFIALEGVVGAGSGDPIEIHALGDQNYHVQTISTSGTVVGGNLIVQLDADYLKAFSTISVNGGVITHGETGEAADLLSRFSDTVFTVSTSNVGGIGIEEESVESFTIQPNPAVNNRATLVFPTPVTGTVRVFDLSGRVVASAQLNRSTRHTLGIEPSGVYFVEVRTGDTVTAQRLIVE